MSLDFFELEGKTALVTGASSGLGHHFSQVLACAGCTVGIAARRSDRLAELEERITALGGRSVILPMDVTDRGSIEAGIATLTEAAGVPTVIINNAGVGIGTPFLEELPEMTAQTVAVNQTGVWDTAQIAANAMVKAGVGGSIINISSITALGTTRGIAAYATSKAAVAHMSKLQALELARYGIRVNAIAPGYFESEMTREALAGPAGDRISKRVPLRRTGRLEELDGILLLLASERGSYMTGTVIPVDGGHLVAGL